MSIKHSEESDVVSDSQTRNVSVLLILSPALHTNCTILYLLLLNYSYAFIISRVLCFVRLRKIFSHFEFNTNKHEFSSTEVFNSHLDSEIGSKVSSLDLKSGGSNVKTVK
jgi:hypothetical protein